MSTSSITAIEEGPVYQATMDEMADLSSLFAKVSHLAIRHGAVRVDPPKQWSRPNLRMRPSSRFFVRTQSLPEAPFVDVTSTTRTTINTTVTKHTETQPPKRARIKRTIQDEDDDDDDGDNNNQYNHKVAEQQSSTQFNSDSGDIIPTTISPLPVATTSTKTITATSPQALVERTIVTPIIKELLDIVCQGPVIDRSKQPSEKDNKTALSTASLMNQRPQPQLQQHQIDMKKVKINRCNNTEQQLQPHLNNLNHKTKPMSTIPLNKRIDDPSISRIRTSNIRPMIPRSVPINKINPTTPRATCSNTTTPKKVKPILSTSKIVASLSAATAALQDINSANPLNCTTTDPIPVSGKGADHQSSNLSHHAINLPNQQPVPGRVSAPVLSVLAPSTPKLFCRHPNTNNSNNNSNGPKYSITKSVKIESSIPPLNQDNRDVQSHGCSSTKIMPASKERQNPDVFMSVPQEQQQSTNEMMPHNDVLVDGELQSNSNSQDLMERVSEQVARNVKQHVELNSNNNTNIINQQQLPSSFKTTRGLINFTENSTKVKLELVKESQSSLSGQHIFPNLEQAHCQQVQQQTLSPSQSAPKQQLSEQSQVAVADYTSPNTSTAPIQTVGTRQLNTQNQPRSEGKCEFQLTNQPQTSVFRNNDSRANTQMNPSVTTQEIRMTAENQAHGQVQKQQHQQQQLKAEDNSVLFVRKEEEQQQPVKLENKTDDNVVIVDDDDEVKEVCVIRAKRLTRANKYDAASSKNVEPISITDTQNRNSSQETTDSDTKPPRKPTKRRSKSLLSNYHQDKEGRLTRPIVFPHSFTPVTLSTYKRQSNSYFNKIHSMLPDKVYNSRDRKDTETTQELNERIDKVEQIFWSAMKNGLKGEKLSVQYGVDVEAKGAYDNVEHSYVWLGKNADHDASKSSAFTKRKEEPQEIQTHKSKSNMKSSSSSQMVDESGDEILDEGKGGVDLLQNNKLSKSKKFKSKHDDTRKRKHASSNNKYSNEPQSHVGNLNRHGLLRHLPSMPGINHTMFYVGQLFTRFCWHVEDAFLNSVSYLHNGSEEKVWYAIPPSYANKFEDYARDYIFSPEIVENKESGKVLLMNKTTIFDPFELKRNGIDVYRVIHKEGSFVLTAPRAYHAGFNCGYNIAEAVNFANPPWLPVGREAATVGRTVKRALCVPWEYLLYHEAQSIYKTLQDDPGQYDQLQNDPILLSNIRTVAEELKRTILEGETIVRKYASKLRVTMLKDVEDLVKHNQLSPEFGHNAGMSCAECYHACHFYAEICGNCEDSDVSRCIHHYGETNKLCPIPGHRTIIVRRHDPILLLDMLEAIEELAGILVTEEERYTRMKQFVRPWQTPLQKSSTGLRLRMNLNLAASRGLEQATEPVEKEKKTYQKKKVVRFVEHAEHEDDQQDKEHLQPMDIPTRATNLKNKKGRRLKDKRRRQMESKEMRRNGESLKRRTMDSELEIVPTSRAQRKKKSRRKDDSNGIIILKSDF